MFGRGSLYVSDARRVEYLREVTQVKCLHGEPETRRISCTPRGARGHGLGHTAWTCSPEAGIGCPTSPPNIPIRKGLTAAGRISI